MYHHFSSSLLTCTQLLVTCCFDYIRFQHRHYGLSNYLPEGFFDTNLSYTWLFLQGNKTTCEKGFLCTKFSCCNGVVKIVCRWPKNSIISHFSACLRLDLMRYVHLWFLKHIYVRDHHLFHHTYITLPISKMGPCRIISLWESAGLRCFNSFMTSGKKPQNSCCRFRKDSQS